MAHPEHTDPCHQEAPIAALTVSVEMINKTLEQMVKGQSEMVELLKADAAQKERNRTTEAQITEIFKRLGAVELKAEGSAARLAVIAGGTSLLGAGAVTAALHLLKLG